MRTPSRTPQAAPTRGASYAAVVAPGNGSAWRACDWGSLTRAPGRRLAAAESRRRWSSRPRSGSCRGSHPPLRRAGAQLQRSSAATQLAALRHRLSEPRRQGAAGRRCTRSRATQKRRWRSRPGRPGGRWIALPSRQRLPLAGNRRHHRLPSQLADSPGPMRMRTKRRRSLSLNPRRRHTRHRPRRRHPATPTRLHAVRRIAGCPPLPATSQRGGPLHSRGPRWRRCWRRWSWQG